MATTFSGVLKRSLSLGRDSSKVSTEQALVHTSREDWQEAFKKRGLTSESIRQLQLTSKNSLASLESKPPQISEEEKEWNL
jgi:hypothetical protein